jgi:hypothetical protein
MKGKNLLPTLFLAGLVVGYAMVNTVLKYTTFSPENSIVTYPKVHCKSIKLSTLFWPHLCVAKLYFGIFGHVKYAMVLIETASSWPHVWGLIQMIDRKVECLLLLDIWPELFGLD